LAFVILVPAASSSYPFRLSSAEAQIDDNSFEVDEDLVSLDEVPPSIKILNPAFCSNSIMSPGIIVVRGVASDDLSGVQKVEAFSETYPFDDTFPFEMAAPSSQSDWSSWSIPVEIHDTRTRILVRATDNAGNENWDEAIIDIEEMKQKHSSRNSPRAVAFVEPSFTAAAYNLDGFYEFYDKYQDVDFGEAITDDLNLMTADIPAEPDRLYFEPILQRVKAFVSPDVEMTIIGDTDVNDGFIFRNDGTNAYEALILLHNEYVTQQEYDNLKRYVSNGGRIIFLDGNLFYGEVSYDRTYCTATLVKGHDWEFDGKEVKRSVSERYFDENKEFLGSNYMINSLWDPISFSNNPFNYTHFEQNYVTNPNVKILHDYGLTIGDNYEGESWHRNATIATYELNYGKGKNVVLGIYAQNESNNPAFLDFFENVVLMHALGNEYGVRAGDQDFSIYWKMQSGTVSKVIADGESGKLTVSIDRIENTTDVLRISLPKSLIDVRSPNDQMRDLSTLATALPPPDQQPQLDAAQSRMELMVTTFTEEGIISSNKISVEQTVTDHERILEIPLSRDIASVEIYGAFVAPEFGLPGLLFIISGSVMACLLSIIKVFRSNRGLKV
jgi:hypothetical protein